MSSTALPAYGNPPVNEVVAGVVYEPLSDLLIPHVGLFWQGLKDRFPLCNHALPLAQGANYNWIDKATQTPLPRIWLVSANEDELLQLQNDRFHFNWRQTMKLEKYPRYPHVIQQFFAHYRAWNTFATEVLGNQIIPRFLELTYINVILRTEKWKSPAQHSKLFTDFHWRPRPKRFLPGPANHAWQAAFPISENGGWLFISTAQAKRISDGADAIRVEISARSEALKGGANESSLRGWFDLGHEWIVRGFADLFQPEVQKALWKRKD